MICPVCDKREFDCVGSSIPGVPRLFSGNEPLSSIAVRIEVLLTCKTCGTKIAGAETSTITCRIDTSTTPYPLHMFEFVRQSYGDGWNTRAKGIRLNAADSQNISMVKGWEEAQAHSMQRGGKAPPKGWGHARSKEYLKTETACHHLKMLSLSELKS